MSAIIHGYTLLEEPRYSTCGQLCKVTQGHRDYLMKIFQNPVEPDPSILDGKTYAMRSAQFEDHKRARTKTNQRLRKCAGEGGSIVAPIDEFVHEGRWAEVAPFLEDTVPPDKVLSTYASLDRRGRLMALRSITASYKALHEAGIVHADAKLSNMLLRQTGSGRYVFAIIDFDGAFLTDDIPIDSIVASVEYFSPEMGLFANMEMEKRKANRHILGCKHDIFALGLIFCQLESGGKMPIPDELPPHLEKRRAKGKPVYLYTAMLAGDEGRWYEAQIPSDVEPGMAALLKKMLAFDPAERPTAEQVLATLSHMDSGEDLILPEAPFVWNRERLLSDGFLRVEAVERYGREGYLMTGFSRSRFMVPGRLLELGYASETPLEDEGFEESILTDETDQPWPEDRIAYDREMLSRRGFQVCRATRNGLKGYRLRSRDGVVRFVPCGTLRLLGLAKGA